MCVILAVPQGLSFGKDADYRHLKNAALNNPHGFGIVTVDRGKLSVFKQFDPKGNDPELIAAEMDKRSKADMRFLHLRFATVGEKNKDNTHPFEVFKNGNRRVMFMHNGGMSMRPAQGDPRSDTRLYAETFLKPLLTRFDGEIEDTLLESILDRDFSYTNRGLLVASNLDASFLGKWDSFDFDGEKIAVSNTDYFERSRHDRMTEHYKPSHSMYQQQQQQMYGGQRQLPFDPTNTTKTGGEPIRQFNKGNVMIKEATPTKDASESIVSIVALKDIDLSKTKRFLEPKDLDALFETTIEAVDDELISYIDLLTDIEVHRWCVTNLDASVKLIQFLSNKCVELIAQVETLEEEKFKKTVTE